MSGLTSRCIAMGMILSVTLGCAVNGTGTASTLVFTAGDGVFYLRHGLGINLDTDMGGLNLSIGFSSHGCLAPRSGSMPVPGRYVGVSPKLPHACYSHKHTSWGGVLNVDGNDASIALGYRELAVLAALDENAHDAFAARVDFDDPISNKLWVTPPQEDHGD